MVHSGFHHAGRADGLHGGSGRELGKAEGTGLRLAMKENRTGQGWAGRVFEGNEI